MPQSLNRSLASIVLALSAAALTAAQAADINVVSSGGFAEAYKELGPRFEKQTGHHLVSGWGPSMGTTQNAIPVRLARGEPLDVVIMVGGSLDTLMQEGKLVAGSKVLLAYSPIACAVKAGARRYDISTVEGLRQAFLTATSIAHSDSASGEYIKNELLDKLGLREQVQAKLVKIPATPVGEIVASGRSELGCQQRSELKPVKGIDILGLLPQEVQLVTPFSAAIVSTSAHKAEGEALLKFLSARESAAVIEETGLQPATQP
jgi:molybdate transport system substrate-binding protein